MIERVIHTEAPLPRDGCWQAALAPLAVPMGQTIGRIDLPCVLQKRCTKEAILNTCQLKDLNFGIRLC